MTYLPDVNVWIALAAAEHVHHDEAVKWFDAVRDETVAFCRITQMGFLRLLTNPHVMLDEVTTARKAWGWYEQLMQDERVVFASEPPGMDRVWSRMTATYRTGVNFWTDTYLASFAQTSGYTFVTFDQGFRKRQQFQIRLLHLK